MSWKPFVVVVGAVCGLLLAGSRASAGTLDAGSAAFSMWTGIGFGHTRLPACGAAGPASPASLAPSLAISDALIQEAAQPLHAAAVEHSDAYEARKKIHKIASFATLPLFAAEVALGSSLFNNTTPSDAVRSAHGIVGAGIIGLFAVNTVTGAWNLLGEDRPDPKGRTLRIVHALLMMVSDAGFVATSMSGPSSGGRHALTFATDEVTHRNLALGSIGVATTGYLIMLFGNH